MTTRERKMSTIEGRVSKSTLAVEGPGDIINTRIPTSENKMKVAGDDNQATNDGSLTSEVEQQEGSVNTEPKATSFEEGSSNRTSDPPEDAVSVSDGVSDTRTMKDRARRRSTAVPKPGAVAVVGDAEEQQAKTADAPLKHAPPGVGTNDESKSTSDDQVTTHRSRRQPTDVKPGVVNDKPLSESLAEPDLDEIKVPASRSDSSCGSTTDVQVMKDRARRRSTALKPGVVAISGAPLTENAPTSPAAQKDSIASVASDLQAMKDRARRRSTVGTEGEHGEIDALSARNALPPGAYQTMEEDLHAKHQKDWVDAMHNSRLSLDSSDLPSETPQREIDAYTQYAETPEFTRYTLTLPDDRSNAATSVDGSHSISRTPSIHSEGTINAPVQHFSSWQEDEEHKSRWDTGFHLNRILCTAGVILICVVVAVVVGVSVGLTAGQGSGGDENNPTQAPVDRFPTHAPVPECASAGDTLDQSERVIQFTQLLGQSTPDSARRKAICWLADADELQLDPANEGRVEQRFATAAFYFSTTPYEDNGLAISNWMDGESECTWLGIVCVGDTVAQFELRSEELVGTLPPELALLSQLTVLDVGNSPGLTGEIPDDLYGISTLTSLALEANELLGTISSHIGELTRLEILRITSTRLNGTLPTELFSIGALGTSYGADLHRILCTLVDHFSYAVQASLILRTMLSQDHFQLRLVHFPCYVSITPFIIFPGICVISY